MQDVTHQLRRRFYRYHISYAVLPAFRDHTDPLHMTADDMSVQASHQPQRPFQIDPVAAAQITQIAQTHGFRHHVSRKLTAAQNNYCQANAVHCNAVAYF